VATQGIPVHRITWLAANTAPALTANSATERATIVAILRIYYPLSVALGSASVPSHDRDAPTLADAPAPRTPQMGQIFLPTQPRQGQTGMALGTPARRRDRDQADFGELTGATSENPLSTKFAEAI
jgi:hypothetical protein